MFCSYYFYSYKTKRKQESKMSRTKHVSTLDAIEMLEFKFEQLEKRLENMERILFSPDSQVLSGNQNNPQCMQHILQLLTTMIDRQNSIVSSHPVGNQLTQGNIKNENITEKNEQEKGSPPIVMGRLRTLF